MENKTKKKLERGLSKIVEEYVDIDLTDPDKAKALSILSRDIKILSEEESLKINDKLKKERQKFELNRSQEQFELEKSKHELEERKLNLEKEKMKLEYAKLEVEKNIKLAEDKKDKRSFFVNMAIKSLEILVPLAINAGLVMMNFRLIYADDGRTPSEMKDLMKNVYRR